MSGPDGGCEGVQGPGGGYEGVGEPGNGRAGVIGPGGRGAGAEDLGGECVGVGGPRGRCAGVGGQVADMGKECEPKSPSKKVDPPPKHLIHTTGGGSATYATFWNQSQ